MDTKRRVARGIIANRELRRDWRLQPALCAFIECQWTREDTDTLRLLCSGCIDAPMCVPTGSTLANALNETYVRGVPR
jgi:hypothetical protein